MASATAAISSSPTAGGWNPRKVSRLDDSLGGIGSDQAYAVRRPASTFERLRTCLAEREHGTDTVGSTTQRPQHGPGRTVDAYPGHARHRSGLLHPDDLEQL